MFRTVTYSLFTVIALSVMLNLLAASSSAQQEQEETKDPQYWYDEARRLLEEFKSQKVDRGGSQQEAMEKAGKLCSEYGDQISRVMHKALNAENQKCRADPECEEKAFARFEKINKEIFDAVKALCASREKEIYDFYNGNTGERPSHEGAPPQQSNSQTPSVPQASSTSQQTSSTSQPPYDRFADPKRQALVNLGVAIRALLEQPFESGRDSAVKKQRDLWDISSPSTNPNPLGITRYEQAKDKLMEAYAELQKYVIPNPRRKFKTEAEKQALEEKVNGIIETARMLLREGDALGTAPPNPPVSSGQTDPVGPVPPTGTNPPTNPENPWAPTTLVYWLRRTSVDA